MNKMDFINAIKEIDQNNLFHNQNATDGIIIFHLAGVVLKEKPKHGRYLV